MKLNYLLSTLALSVGLSNAATNFFKGFERAEIFEKTEFNMPTFRIKLSDESYDRLQLTYKCLYDTNALINNENEDCYTAPWVNYTQLATKLHNLQYLSTANLSEKQKKLMNDPNLGYSDFKSIVKAGCGISVKEIFSQQYGIVEIPVYEEKKASLEAIIDGKTFSKDIKFSIGGKYTKVFEKQQFNIKIKNGDLLGRQQLRLRSEVVDPSFLRSKIGYDLSNILGFPSVQASYAKVYINNDNMGLYLLRDIFKSQWIEYNFGIANTTTLYTCDHEYGTSYYFNCINDETEVVDDTFRNFLSKLEKAKNVDELSKFFDVDLYIRWQAFKYLLGSWDHITYMHNQYLFYDGKKWMNLLYDFDSDFGAYKTPNSALSFVSDSYEMNLPLYKLIGLDNNHQTLVKYITQFVKEGFNPAKLFPRIDELMSYLYPYIVEDRTPELQTTLRPGHFKRPDLKIENTFSVNDHLRNAEYHNYYLKKYIDSTNYTIDEIYGLKRWIIERFRYVCSRYSIDCSFAKEYLEGGSYTIPSKESTMVYMEQHLGGCKDSGYPCCINPNGQVITVDVTGEWSVEGNNWCLLVKDQKTTTTTTTTTTKASIPTSSSTDDCWSIERGYPCCVSATTVYYTSSNGKTWSVENGDWCGIRDTPAVTTTTTTTTTKKKTTTTTTTTTTKRRRTTTTTTTTTKAAKTRNTKQPGNNNRQNGPGGRGRN